MIVGIIGGLLVLLGYYLATIGYNVRHPIEFNTINAFGALFLIINALQLSAWAFVGLNFVWIMIAIKNLYKRR